MELARLCDLLGFKQVTSYEPTQLGYMYKSKVILEGDPEYSYALAKQNIQAKLEKILEDVVNANKEKK